MELGLYLYRRVSVRDANDGDNEVVSKVDGYM